MRSGQGHETSSAGGACVKTARNQYISVVPISRLAAPMVAYATLCVLTTGAAGAQEISECETSERLEIFNEVLERHLAARGLEPVFGCESGPWRTFGDDAWLDSDTHLDFMMVMATVPVPEPRATSLAASALFSLILLALTSRVRQRRP